MNILLLYCSYLSLFSFTFFIFVPNRSSLITQPCWSSHMITLFSENFGLRPPPTKARMFDLFSIWIWPIPPSRSNQNYFFKITSTVCFFKRIRAENLKPFVGAYCETGGVLVEGDIKHFVFYCVRSWVNHY